MFGISFMGSPSSELFLTLSGTVLLPVKVGVRQFYKRRFMKLLPPLLIWSILGTVFFAFIEKISWHDAWNAIVRIPFAAGNKSLLVRICNRWVVPNCTVYIAMA